MTNILYITASIRSDEDSVSRSLGRKLVDRLVAQTGATVTTRDLSAQHLPPVTAERFAANITPAEDRNRPQEELASVADTLIAELQAADAVVIASPIYNFNAPATLKTWADLVARAGTTFKYTETGPVGLLTGKKAYVVVATGGTPVGSDIDFMSRWLTFFLGFIGITDVEVIAADGLMGADASARIDAANDRIAAIAA